MKTKRSKVFFTLVELLVVIAVMTLLASLLMPALNRSLSVAKRIVCANNEKQLHLAWMNYVDAANGALPAARTDIWGDSTSSGDPVHPLRKWPQLMILELDPALNPKNKAAYMPKRFLTCPAFRYSDPLVSYDIRRCQFTMSVCGIGGCNKIGGRIPGLTHIHKIRNISRMPAFGDNMEESYMLAATECDVGQVAFRHFTKANVIYVDGHVQQEKNTFNLSAESKNNQ